MREVFILECEQCNGEYGVTVHKSVHGSRMSALSLFNKLLDPEDVKCEGATNEWREDSSDRNKDQYRTGLWGFVVWTITSLPLYEEPVYHHYSDKNLETSEIIGMTLLDKQYVDHAIKEMISYYNYPNMFSLSTKFPDSPTERIFYRYNYGPTAWDSEEMKAKTPKFEEWLVVVVPELPFGTKFKTFSTGQLRELFLRSPLVKTVECKEGIPAVSKILTKEELESFEGLPPKDRDPNNPWDDGLDDKDEVVSDRKPPEPESPVCSGGCGRHPDVCMCHDDSEAYK